LKNRALLLSNEISQTYETEFEELLKEATKMP